MHHSQTSGTANRKPTADLSGAYFSISECEYLINLLNKEAARLKAAGDPLWVFPDAIAVEIEDALDASTDEDSEADCETA